MDDEAKALAEKILKLVESKGIAPKYRECSDGISELISAHADITRAKALREAAEIACSCRCHKGIEVTCICGGGWECKYGEIMSLIHQPAHGKP